MSSNLQITPAPSPTPSSPPPVGFFFVFPFANTVLLSHFRSLGENRNDPLHVFGHRCFV
jgi:hypothetical protein